MFLIEAIDDYLRYLQHEQGAAKSTLKSYHACLHNFLTWAKESYPEPSLSDFSPATVRRYFYYTSSRGLRPRSVRGYMHPLRGFGAFCVEHKLLTENPALVVKMPQKDAAVRREASEEECAALLEAVTRQRNQQRAVFQKAVLSVLIFTGLRRAEVCDLKLTDVDLSGGWLLVASGKGNKSRKVPLCSEAKDALAAYLAIRSPETAHGYLFAVDRKRRLYFNGIKSVVEEVKCLAGFADRKHIVPHAMRHACASRLMANGASLLEIMTWLGHSQVSTTQQYLHTNERALKNAAALASLAQDNVIDARDRLRPQARQDERQRRRIAR